MKTPLAMATLIALVLGGCVADEPAAAPDEAEETSTIPDVADEPAAMPDVVGEQLDVALSEIESAGFTEDVELLGGGTLGVVVKANWQVCAQLPEPGEELTEPRLTVERSCEEEAAASTTTEPVSTTAPTTTEPNVLETLTVANSPELAAILTEGDYCADSIGAFAAANGGRTIEFDGHITAVSPHGGAQTRFDILVSPGDYSETSQAGPTFQFRDVNPMDMKLTGDVPGALEAGQAFRFTAEVGEYASSSCLFILRPVNTHVR